MTAIQSSSKTADLRQGIRLIGIVLLVVAVLGYAVLPLLDPGRSKLVGELAPGFTLPVMVNGEPGSQLSLSDLRGRTVVLDFWASWCAPCRAQAPVIDRVARGRDGKDVIFVGVSTSGDNWANAVEFAKSENLSYASVFDGDSAVGNAYRVRTLPTLVIIDAEGTVRAVRTRVVRQRELESMIEDATKAGAS